MGVLLVVKLVAVVIEVVAVVLVIVTDSIRGTVSSSGSSYSQGAPYQHSSPHHWCRRWERAWISPDRLSSEPGLVRWSRSPPGNPCWAGCRSASPLHPQHCKHKQAAWSREQRDRCVMEGSTDFEEIQWDVKTMSTTCATIWGQIS